MSTVTTSMAQAKQNYGDGPYALITDTGLEARPEVPRDHYVVEFTRSMALVHNQILRALNAAHNHCLTVGPGTQAAQDFLIFNQCIVDVLESHHDMEEERLFPALEKILNQPGAMEGNRQEHQAFHDELLEFHSYVFTTDPKEYHGATMKAKIEALGPLVEEHLHNEVPLLYDHHVIDSEALKSLWKDAMDGYKPKFNLFRHFPFMVTCADNTFLLDGHIAPFPGFPPLVGYVVKFLLGFRFSGAWEFSPSDFAGRPRPMLHA